MIGYRKTDNRGHRQPVECRLDTITNKGRRRRPLFVIVFYTPYTFCYTLHTTHYTLHTSTATVRYYSSHGQ
jgi:hypothetical protein